jgi:cell division protein FtsI/penicillin-binding protein 2
VYKEKWRFYPGGQTAAHVLGLLGYKGDEYGGRYGLERQYETALKRDDKAYVNFFAQIFANLKSATLAGSEENEGDVITTIEPTIQEFLETELASTSEKWSAHAVGGIIMNPATGEIVALAATPTFDPNRTDKEKKVSVFSNPLVENVYEMGSIIKPLTIAAGIDAGVITAQSTYYDPGYVFINGKKISNFDGKERGVVDMQQVLSQSLNVGVAKVASLLGNERFTDYFYKFGLNEKTNVDLPNEGRNLVDNLKSTRDLEHATASFGQGIALTPISTIRALAAIANNGVLVHPHVAKKIQYKVGFSKEMTFPVGTAVIKPETAAEVARMMTWSVDNTLVNGTLKIPNYTVAAKTGTAQVARENGGGYYEDKVLHSFVGFFPVSKPQFIIFLYMLDPKGARFGSETLSFPFMKMVNFIINYYEIPPDR